MPSHADPGLVFALALGAGVLGQLMARHLRTPSIVILLALGVVMGPDGVGWVAPRALGDGLLALVSIAVAVILFEGALNLDLARMRHAQSAIRMLITVGAAVTAVGGTLAARWIMGWDWRVAILFGTLVIVTGPTVIGPLLRNVPLRRRLATTLEAEGVFIDPVGAIVAAVALEVLLVPSGEVVGLGISELGLRLGFGTLSGGAFGLALGLLLRQPRWVPEGLENLVTLGSVLVLFAVSNAVVSESGILAVVVAGVAVANLHPGSVRELQEFQEHLTVGLVGVLFVLLAADVRLVDVAGLGWPGVATVAALMLVVRPLDVVTSTASSELDWREKAFLSWIAPRGIVAAAVASLAAVLMDGMGMEGGAELRALVFLTIAATVVLQGATAAGVARLLRVRAPERAATAILGAEELGLALGDVLREAGVEVVFLDANPGHCQHAEERGFPVVFGNALDERVLVRARLERCRAVIGLTANDEVNSLFAREARDDFGVPETYVAIGRGATVTPRILQKQSSRALFDGPKDVERWNVRFRHGQAELGRYRFEARPDEEEGGATGSALDPFVLLAVERDGACLPMHGGFQAREGDVARVAVYKQESDSAREALARLGWVPAPDAAPGEAEAADGD